MESRPATAPTSPGAAYHKVDFADVWRRYLPEEPSETVPAVQKPDDQEKDREALRDTEKSHPAKPSGRNARSATTPDASDSFGRFVSDGSSDDLIRKGAKLVASGKYAPR
jgi:hypothetical protein